MIAGKWFSLTVGETYLGFEVFAAVTMKNAVFWVI
jgi:hypothetical protein